MHYLLCLILVIVCTLKLSCQEPYYIVYDTNNGLPSSEIYDIIQDEEGVIWISTDRGVVSYDGDIFELFTKENGLSDNTIFNLYLDGLNRIWFSGYNKTLSLKDGNKIIAFSNGSVIGKQSSHGPGSWITNILMDSLENYYFFPNESIEKEVYRYEKSIGLEKINVNELEVLKLDSITFYKIGDEYLNFFISKTAKYSNIEFYKSRKALNYSGFIFSADNKVVYKRKENGSSQFYKFPDVIEKIYIDFSGNLWVCTRNGLYSFLGTDLSYKPKVYFKNHLVSTIIQDFEGNYWIGTNASGVLMVPAFEIAQIISKNANPNFNRVVSCCKQKDIIAFGTSNKSLVIIDKKDKQKTYEVPKASTNKQINNIVKWKEENSFIIDDGLVFENGRFFPQENFYLSGNIPVNSPIIIFRNGDFIRLASNQNFNVYKSQLNKVVKPIYPSNIDGRLQSAIQDDNLNLWFGTFNGLLKVENYDYDNIFKIKDQRNRDLGRLTSLLYENGILFAGSIGNGAYAIKEDYVVCISDHVELSSNMINQALAVNDSILWLATNNGIDVLKYSWNDTISLEFLRNISTSDGLASNYVNDIEYWNGYIWAATNSGLCRFKPDIINKEVPQIPISITNFENQDSTYSLGQNYEFNHSQNDILISYSGLSYRQGKDKIEYKYRLIKDNKEDESKWYFTNDRNQRFNDLAPGNYLFEVNAKNKIRIWNDNPASISFTIQPHFSQTLFFKISIGLLTLLGIYLIYRAQINRIKKRQDNEKELSKAKQQVQEAELASIRNQMNPHFVYNSLNSIQNLIFKNDKAGANRYLSIFSKLMRESLQYTSLDFINLEQEIQFLTNYMNLEALRFPEKFNFSFEIDEDILPSHVLIPSLILQPIVENSIKHGFDNIDYVGEIKIKIDLLVEDLIVLTVSDNGIGEKSNIKSTLNATKSHTSLGKDLVKTRINLLNSSEFNGSATFSETILEKGYKTVIKIPLKTITD